MSEEKDSVAVQTEASPDSQPATSEGWAPFVSLREEIDRLFDDFGSGNWRRSLIQRAKPDASKPMAWRLSPVIEVVDCNGEYRIAAELPGLSPDDVEMTLHDRVLTIRGQKSEENREEKDDYLVSERRYGSFYRTIPLPAGADAENIHAELSNGVLNITMPKTADAKVAERKIEVKAA